MKGKVGLVVLLFFGFSVIIILTAFRMSRGIEGGLSLIAAAVLLPLILWILFKYNEKVLDNLKDWLYTTNTQKGTLIFSAIFWYIGFVAIVAYSLYDNLLVNILIIGVVGILLGSSTYKGLLKKL